MVLHCLLQKVAVPFKADYKAEAAGRQDNAPGNLFAVTLTIVRKIKRPALESQKELPVFVS